ncbi:hypothetical protein R69608_04973 [Paraburkholderia nemoris]|nr:hypothetical protein R69608_04973 [Paraburkholderia nemoris]
MMRRLAGYRLPGRCPAAPSRCKRQPVNRLGGRPCSRTSGLWAGLHSGTVLRLR